jgi:hypothetical protein
MTVFIADLDLTERLRRVTDKIFRSILCIETQGNITNIAIHVPLRIFGPCNMAPKPLPFWAVNPGIIRLSWESLAHVSVEGRIPSLFTEFITTPERSGPLYVSPDDYHTQVTEYSLHTIFQRNNNLQWALFLSE